MGYMRTVTGQLTNIFNSRRHIVTMTSEDANYPKHRLGDGRPSKEARFASAAANVLVRTDGNIITNGTPSSDASVDRGKLDGWTGSGPDGFTKTLTGTGAVTQEGTIVRTGSSAAVNPGSSGTADFFIDLEVKSGQVWTVEAWLRGGTGGGQARAEIQNRDTKRYLTSGGVWQTTQADWATDGNLGFVQKVLPFTVESYAACGWRDKVTLRLRFYNTVASTNAYFEDIAFYPSSIDLLVMNGHNIDPSIDVQWVADDDPAFGSPANVAALSPFTVPAGYRYVSSPIALRYQQVGFVGTNSVGGAIELGELGAYQSIQPLQQYEAPIFWEPMTWNRQQSRGRTGERFGFRWTKYEQRRAIFTYHFFEQAQLDDAFAIWRRAEGGTWPVIVVPDTDRPEVLLGHLPDSFSMTRDLRDFYNGFEVPVEEAPFYFGAA